MRSHDGSWNARTDSLQTDFWGPVSNFGIPIAAIADMSKDPEMYVFNTYTLLLLQSKSLFPIHYSVFNIFANVGPVSPAV